MTSTEQFLTVRPNYILCRRCGIGIIAGDGHSLLKEAALHSSYGCRTPDPAPPSSPPATVPIASPTG